MERNSKFFHSDLLQRAAVKKVFVIGNVTKVHLQQNIFAHYTKVKNEKVLKKATLFSFL
jgi:hypothetical protein